MERRVGDALVPTKGGGRVVMGVEGARGGGGGGWGLKGGWGSRCGRSSNLGGGPVGESGAARLFPKTRECVWVIGCASTIMFLMVMLNYKDKLFDK